MVMKVWGKINTNNFEMVYNYREDDNLSSKVVSVDNKPKETEDTN
jgi:hypothetical protein